MLQVQLLLMALRTRVEEGTPAPPVLDIHNEVDERHEDKGEARGHEYVRQGPEKNGGQKLIYEKVSYSF